jgi:hypothetical protein
LLVLCHEIIVAQMGQIVNNKIHRDCIIRNANRARDARRYARCIKRAYTRYTRCKWTIGSGQWTIRGLSLSIVSCPLSVESYAFTRR